MRQLTLAIHLRATLSDIDAALAVRQGDDTRAILRGTRETVARMLARIEARAVEKAAPRERVADGDVRDFEIG